MRRFFIVLFPLLLGQCVDGSTPGTGDAFKLVPEQRLSINSTPVVLQSDRPEMTRVGALTFLGGWALSSDTRGFGAISALDVNGSMVTALSDNGTITQFRLGRFGNVSNAIIFRAPKGCGDVRNKHDNDTEAFAHDPDRQVWWISYEWRNVVCRVNADLDRAELVTKPRAIADWPKKQGAETMLRLADGRFLFIAEDAKDGGSLRPAALFDRDPTDPAAIATTVNYHAPEGYKPVDAAQLPDGRILVLNRRFAIPDLFTSKIALIDAIGDTPPDVIEGRTIATLAPPLVAENFEGISVSEEGGRLTLWLASDDNFMRWQRTLLLKFAIN